MLSAGQKPNFLQILDLTPPPGFEVWEPDSAGIPRRWAKPWKKLTPTSTTEPATLSVTDREPIVKIAATAASPIDCAAGEDDQDYGGATFLGYKWSTSADQLSTNKSAKLNLYPARQGIKPAWGMIYEASKLLCLHRLKPLKHCQDLSYAHVLYGPVHFTPWNAATLKFM